MSFFRDKRVVVTGGARFLGKNVVKKLKAEGCDDIFVPRNIEYNLIVRDIIKSLNICHNLQPIYDY